MKDGPSEEDSKSEHKQEEPEGARSGTLEDQVLSLCRVVRENVVDLMKDAHGSHVLRTLIHVLAGCSTQEQPDARPGGRTRDLTYKNNLHYCALRIYLYRS